jgi:hypothetical protein
VHKRDRSNVELVMDKTIAKNNRER